MKKGPLKKRISYTKCPHRGARIHARGAKVQRQRRQHPRVVERKGDDTAKAACRVEAAAPRKVQQQRRHLHGAPQQHQHPPVALWESPVVRCRVLTPRSISERG